MLTVISPAKSLDTESPVPEVEVTQPRFLADATILARAAAKLSPKKLKGLMHISDKLAALNAGRFAAFSPPFTPDNARPAIHMFAGDVYTGFGIDSASPETRDFARDHVRILSGLYGLLRPFDLMQPYRLEMGTKFGVGRKKTLYAWWGDRIAKALADDLAGHADRTLVNLASTEYLGAVVTKALPGPVITPTFREWRNGELRFISFSAKTARGAMARFICDERIDHPEGLRDFARDGYRFEPGLSDDTALAFVRG